MKLIIGLGNTGSAYTNTRHNFGHLFIDALAERYRVTLKKLKSTALAGKVSLGTTSVILAKTCCFMNESGRAVSTLKRFYKIPIQDIIVAYDDLDLPFGTVRVRQNISGGGHKGIQSILLSLRGTAFLRVRLGIGPKNKPAEKYVLEEWTKKEKSGLPTILKTTEKKLLEVLR